MNLRLICREGGAVKTSKNAPLCSSELYRHVKKAAGLCSIFISNVCVCGGGASVCIPLMNGCFPPPLNVFLSVSFSHHLRSPPPTHLTSHLPIFNVLLYFNHAFNLFFFSPAFVSVLFHFAQHCCWSFFSHLFF